MAEMKLVGGKNDIIILLDNSYKNGTGSDGKDEISFVEC